MTFHIHWCCSSLSSSIFTAPLQGTASPPAGIIPHWRTGLPLPTRLLPPSLWWFKDLGQSETFLSAIHSSCHSPVFHQEDEWVSGAWTLPVLLVLLASESLRISHILCWVCDSPDFSIYQDILMNLLYSLSWFYFIFLLMYPFWVPILVFFSCQNPWV